MSEQEHQFLELLEEKFSNAIEDIERRHNRTVTTLGIISGGIVTILAVVLAFTLSSFSTVGARLSDVESTGERNEKDITYIYQNTPSKIAINKLLESFKNIQEVEERFFPEKIQEGIREMHRLNTAQWNEIMKYSSDINTRGIKESPEK